jgi:hypothetical protein
MQPVPTKYNWNDFALNISERTDRDESRGKTITTIVPLETISITREMKLNEEGHKLDIRAMESILLMN